MGPQRINVRSMVIPMTKQEARKVRDKMKNLPGPMRRPIHSKNFYSEGHLKHLFS